MKQHSTEFVGEILLGGSPGALSEVLISQGAVVPPIWGTVLSVLPTPLNIADVVLSNGGSLATDLNPGDTINLSAYDVDGTSYVDFLRLTANNSPSLIVLQPLVWTAGMKQVFTPSGTTAGLNSGTLAGDPSVLADGDIWTNSSLNVLRARINGVTVSLGVSSGVATIGVIDSQAKAANGAVITGTSLVFQTADLTNPGLVSNAAQIFSGAKTVRQDAIAAVSTDALVLQNITPAISGTQQFSPRLRLTGAGFATTGAVSRAVDWIAEVQPVQGTTPTASLVFSSQINAGGYTPNILLLSDGRLQIGSGGPTLKNTGTILEAKVSNDSAFTFVRAQFATEDNNAYFRTGRLDLSVISGIQWGSGGPIGPYDLSLTRSQSKTIRVGDGVATTGVGNLLIAPSTGGIGTNGLGVLGIGGSTEPTTSPLGMVQLYSISPSAGDAQLFVRNQAGLTTRLTGTITRVSTQFDKTDTTLTDVPGLSFNVEAGKTYSFTVNLYTTSDIGGGVKAAIAGTATATSIVYEVLTVNAGLITQSRAAALGTSAGAVTAVTVAMISITGTIIVNAAGTLTVQFAENVAVATSSVLVGSIFTLVQN